MPSMVNVGPVDSSPHMGEIVSYRYLFIFFSNIWLSGTRTADTGRSTTTNYISTDAVWPKDVPFEGFNAKKLYLEELFPKNSLIFWPEKGFTA
jgi:hypothetical protein